MVITADVSLLSKESLIDPPHNVYELLKICSSCSQENVGVFHGPPILHL